MAFQTKFDPAIPQELRAMPPRMILWRKGVGARSIVGMIITGPLFGLFGLALLTYVIGEPIFMATAPLKDARITSQKIIHGKSTTYRIYYRYTLNGNRQDGSDAVDRATYENLETGDTIKVRAAMIGPWAVSIFPASISAIGMGFVWVFAIIWNTVTIGVFYGGIIIPRWLVREGTPIMGRIEGKRIVRGKNISYELKYSFQPIGSDAVLRTMSVPRTIFDGLTERDPVVVLYDPMKPKRSIIYEYGPYRAAGPGLLG